MSGHRFDIPSHMVEAVDKEFRVIFNNKRCDMCGRELPLDTPPSVCSKCPEGWTYDQCPDCSVKSTGVCDRDHDNLPTLESVFKQLEDNGVEHKEERVVFSAIGKRTDAPDVEIDITEEFRQKATEKSDEETLTLLSYGAKFYQMYKEISIPSDTPADVMGMVRITVRL